DRRDVDNRSMRRLEFIEQATRQHDRREKVHVEHVLPDVDRRIERTQTRSALSLGRDRGIVDKRMKKTVCETAFDLGNGLLGVLGIGEIDLNGSLRPHFPWTVFRKGMARACDDAPAGGGKAFYRGVADAAAGSCQQKGAAGMIVVRLRHASL